MSRQPPNNPDLQEQLRLAKELRFRGGYSGRSTSRGSLHGADSTRGRGSIHVRSFGPTGASEFSQSYQTSRQGISRASPGSSGFSTGAVTTAIASSTPRSAAIPLITRRNPATSANGASNDVPPHLKNMPHTKFVARPAEAAFDLQAPTIFRDITNQPASQPLVTGSKGNGGSNKDVNVDICPDDKDNIFMAQRSTSGSGSASGDFTTTASRQLKINGHSMPETSEQTDMANELPSMARIPVNRRSEVPIVASLYRPKTSSPVPKPSTSLPFNNRSHLQAVPQPIARNIHLATNEESIRYDTSQAAVQGVSSGSPHHIRRISNSGDIEMTGVSEANTRPAARKHGGIVASVWADFSSPGSTTTPPAESDSSNVNQMSKLASNMN